MLHGYEFLAITNRQGWGRDADRDEAERIAREQNGGKVTHVFEVPPDTRIDGLGRICIEWVEVDPTGPDYPVEIEVSPTVRYMPAGPYRLVYPEAGEPTCPDCGGKVITYQDDLACPACGHVWADPPEK